MSTVNKTYMSICEECGNPGSRCGKCGKGFCPNHGSRKDVLCDQCFSEVCKGSGLTKIIDGAYIKLN